MTATTKDVWVWMNAGCNANEIATYLHITPSVAQAWMTAARLEFVRSHVH